MAFSDCAGSIKVFILILLIVSCGKEPDDENTNCDNLSVITGVITKVNPTSALYFYSNVSNIKNCTIISTGACWGISDAPTVYDSKIIRAADDYSSRIDGLLPNTVYYLRAFAINESGIYYGNQISFKTLDVKPAFFNTDLQYDSLTDIENNTYKVIEIGSQVWMAENLRTTKYNDGTDIREVTAMFDWINLQQPAFCYYDFNSKVYKSTYGALYNWYAVNTGKLCPAGWHIPDLNEWETLGIYLGGENMAGAKLKETGDVHWLGNNGESSNITGFTALPGSFIHGEGGFLYIGESAFFWSATVDASWATQPGYAFSFFLDNQTNRIIRGNLYMPHGLSVRCVRNVVK